MHNVEERYDKKGKAKPCFLDQDDLVNLARLIQEDFTRHEVERYFRVSTTQGNVRVFANTMGDFLVKKDLPDKVTDLSFWIEGWGHKTRFDKNVLLDFSRYSTLVQVEGTDPVWVYDKYNKIMKFLESKTAWYWPVIILEKFILFSMTLMLIASLLISYKAVYYVSKLGLLGLWTLMIFYDTRKIWPYSLLRLKGKKSLLNKENLLMVALLAIIIMVFMDGIITPLFSR